jgi:hypothetical protein
MTSRMRRGGVVGRMNYTIIQSPLAYMLIAATDQGIAWLGFGDSDQQAIDEIRSDFPDLELTSNENACAQYARPIVAFLEDRKSVV